ncbi:tetraspanin 39D [Brevipalpus obovatus]|uniref:tetraspanin 39D n=1 Tax=Brevipalpus obovatus TaxID=246614 RepID=UPI003D9EE992
MKGVISTSMKYLLFFTNFTFMIFGLLSVIYGGMVLYTSGDVKSEIVDVQKAPSVLSLIIGVAITVICFLGCCGAIRENYFMLVTFGFAVFILFIVELTLAGVLYSNRDKVDQLSQKGFDELIRNYPNSTSIKNALDDLQSSFECCGGDSYKDWENTNITIPWSCCGTDKAATCEQRKAYNRGCIATLKEKLGKFLTVLAGIGITFGVFQLFGVLFSCGLAFIIRRSYESV